MTNLISLAVLIIFLFVFLANNLNWSFKSLKSEIHLLDKAAYDLNFHRSKLMNANLVDLKIGELD